jgi:hypothetical protein
LIEEPPIQDKDGLFLMCSQERVREMQIVVEPIGTAAVVVTLVQSMLVGAGIALAILLSLSRRVLSQAVAMTVPMLAQVRNAVL